MHKLRWNDLQIVMAVAEHGSASAAALALGLNHSTVIRRVSAFEAEQGVQLFERRPSGYAPTAAGQALLRASQRIAETITDIEREILGQDQKLAGDVVLTTTDTLACSVLMPLLAEFRELHPEITVTLSVTNTRLDLRRLDADIGLRPSRNPPEELIGRRVSGLAFGIYGREGNFDAAAFGLHADHAWLGASNALLNSPVGTWMDETLVEPRIVARADSFVALRELAATGVGLAVLPCCLGDVCPALSRLTAPIAALETSLWILTHSDLRSSARVRALSNHLARGLRRERPRLEGVG